MKVDLAADTLFDLDAIDRAGALDFLADMVRFKSYSDTEGEAALGRFMHDSMASLGLDTKMQPVTETRRNAIGTLIGTGGGKSLLFNGHIDTNPVTEGWTVDPWGGVVDKEFIYGIGVSNMKAGDAAYFWAVKTLLDQGFRPRGDVVLTYVVGELQGGIGTYRAVEQGVKADYFINAEPTDLTAMTLHAGSFDLAIELTGITRHVSKREEAVDVILAASALMPRLTAMGFSGAANDEHASVNRAHIGVMKAALGKELHDWRAPQVADYALLRGTGRYAPSQTVEGVLEDIAGLLSELEAEFPGLKAEVRRANAGEGKNVMSMLPFEVAKTSPIVTAVNEAYAQVTGTAQPTGAIRPYCFYGTDASHLLHKAGMEGVVCGPGGKYNTMPDERVEITDFINMIKIYMLAIERICGLDRVA